jgi:hypothetical protein
MLIKSTPVISPAGVDLLKKAIKDTPTGGHITIIAVK